MLCIAFEFHNPFNLQECMTLTAFMGWGGVGALHPHPPTATLTPKITPTPTSPIHFFRPKHTTRQARPPTPYQPPHHHHHSPPPPPLPSAALVTSVISDPVVGNSYRQLASCSRNPPPRFTAPTLTPAPSPPFCSPGDLGDLRPGGWRHLSPGPRHPALPLRRPGGGRSGVASPPCPQPFTQYTTQLCRCLSDVC